MNGLEQMINLYLSPIENREVDCTPKWKKEVAMQKATHTGKRLRLRGKCEKCGTPTNWVVDVMGRVGAYWCGCP